MKMLYIANARMPTEKAHGLTIVKSCEAFAKAGVDVTLVVPARHTDVRGDVFSVYAIERLFRVMKLPVIDALWWSGSRAAFVVEVMSFYTSVFLFMFFQSRANVVYTRDAPLCLLSWLGFRVVHEGHMIPARRALFFWLMRRAERVVVISHALAHEYMQAGFAQSDILVAPSGVDLDIFKKESSQSDARRELRLPLGVPLAVYTGNFTTMGKDKGVADSIAALRFAKGVVFAAFGGSNADIETYADVARRAGVSEQVILRPHSPQTVLALAQQAADILLMPFPDTPHYRNHMSPVKMFEYMASGRPVIATDLPTVREVLDDTTAFIVPPNDPESLAREILHVVASRDEAMRRSHKAREMVKEFSWEARSRRIVSMMEKMLR